MEFPNIMDMHVVAVSRKHLSEDFWGLKNILKSYGKANVVLAASIPDHEEDKESLSKILQLREHMNLLGMATNKTYSPELIKGDIL